MNNKPIMLFAVLSMLTMACNTEMQEIETIVFDYSSNTPVYQYDRVENISLIPLQTDENYLIGEMPELKIAGDNLFILHGRYSPSGRIDRFTINGQHLNQVGRHGRGPGELNLQALSDWFFCGDNMIGLREYFSENILLYNFSGNFKRKTHLNTPKVDGFGPSYMIHWQNSHFLALMPAQADSSFLISLSESETDVRTMLNSKKTYPFDLELFPPFFQSNDKLYFRTIHENAIYKAEQDTVILAFLTNPGKYAIPSAFYDKFSDELLIQNGAALVYNFLESKDYYVIQLIVKQLEFEGLVWGIKYKQEKEWFWSKMETWELGAFEYASAGLTEDNRLLMLIPPYSLKEQLPLMKNLLNPQIADSLKEDDNPVLVEIRLR